MAARVQLNDGGSYFAAPKKGVEFISTGCQRLDLALGGGWVEGRIGNVVGDKSTGKTLLMIEAAANFIQKYPKGLVFYRESEAAFDVAYAQALGMPVKSVDFGTDTVIETVEDFFEDVQRVCKRLKGRKGLYILDSLDALSDRAELLRDMDEGTYGAAKAKQLSQMFRRVVRAVEAAGLTLLIVSQIRDKIGAMFGRKFTRSGGKALDFYATHVVLLSQLGRINRTRSKVQRAVGVQIKAMVDKNKIALPFRDAQFNILFGYGIDDTEASARWLNEVGRLKESGITGDELDKLKRAVEVNIAPERLAKLRRVTERAWFEIETSFLPKRTKYACLSG